MSSPDDQTSHFKTGLKESHRPFFSGQARVHDGITIAIQWIFFVFLPLLSPFTLDFTSILQKIKCLLLIFICINFVPRFIDCYLFVIFIIFLIFLKKSFSLNILFHLIFVSNFILIILILIFFVYLSFS